MSELEQIIDKLNTIEEQNILMNQKIDELLQWKATMNERFISQREKTQEINDAIFGKNGLTARVQTLWNYKGALRDKSVMWQDFGMYILKAIVIAGLLAVIGVILNAWKFFKNGGR